jgi:hypothetical protein
VDNEETEVAVKPVMSWPLPTVTTVTPPASSRIAARNISPSTSVVEPGSEAGEGELSDMVAAFVMVRTELRSVISSEVGRHATMTKMSCSRKSFDGTNGRV